MNIFYRILLLFQGILLRIFPSLGYRGVVDAQISVYKKLKTKMPALSENEILRHLIISRVKALPRVLPEKEEYAYYEPLLNNPQKTLENVIWEIVFFEYFRGRTNEFKRKGVPPSFLSEQILEARQYIKQKVENLIKK